MSINHRELCVQVRCTHTYIHTSTRCSPQRFRLMRWSSNQRRGHCGCSPSTTAHSAQRTAFCVAFVVCGRRPWRRRDGATAFIVELCGTLSFADVFCLCVASAAVDCGLWTVWTVERGLSWGRFEGRRHLPTVSISARAQCTHSPLPAPQHRCVRERSHSSTATHSFSFTAPPSYSTRTLST